MSICWNKICQAPSVPEIVICQVIAGDWSVVRVFVGQLMSDADRGQHMWHLWHMSTQRALSVNKLLTSATALTLSMFSLTGQEMGEPNSISFLLLKLVISWRKGKLWVKYYHKHNKFIKRKGKMPSNNLCDTKRRLRQGLASVDVVKSFV